MTILSEHRPDTIEEIGKLVDDTVVLETPPSFQAVAEVYLNWYDVPDLNL